MTLLQFIVVILAASFLAPVVIALLIKWMDFVFRVIGP